jgi:hypothetical protein
VGQEHPCDSFAVELGEARLLEDVREEHSGAEFVWDFKGDDLFLEVEWYEDGKERRATYLSSSVDMRYVHPVKSSVDEEMTA